jgi:hypothetical protein
MRRRDRPRQEAVVKDPGVHVLHIAKTGGTTLNGMLAEHRVRRTASGRPIFIHNHSTTLVDVLSRHRRNQAVVFLRDPLSRFVSGFNSRQREGKPEKHVPWKAEEKVAFKYFKTPNDLAEALSSRRTLVQDRALFAIGALPHARNRYTFYLRSPEYVESRFHKIAFMGFQDTFNEDVIKLFALLGVNSEITVEHRHKAPATSRTDLSPRAIRNLREWLADDIKLFEWAREQRDRFTLERAAMLRQRDVTPEVIEDVDSDESGALEAVEAMEVDETDELDGELAGTASSGHHDSGSPMLGDQQSPSPPQ